MKSALRFKLYKASKKWCIMAIATGLSLVGVVASAHADANNPTNDNNVNVVQVNNGAQQQSSIAKTTEVSQTNSAEETPNTTTAAESVNGTQEKQAAANNNTEVETQTTKNGWQHENNTWTYYTNGQVANGRNYSYLPTIDKNDGSHNWYLVDNGVAQSGVQQWAGTYYDFDPSTYLRVDNNYVQSQWGDWYMFGQDGRIATKVYQWAGTYYYFDPLTYLRVDNDYRQSQWGDWYMFGPDGRIVSGVYQWAGTYYYFDPSTYLRVNNDYRQSQWGDWYMFGGDGRIVSGFCNWYGSLYYFDPSTYLKLVNTFFNGNGSWGVWNDHYADNTGKVHSVAYFSQFNPISAPEGCAAASLAMLLSIKNVWPGLGRLYNTLPQAGGVYNVGAFSGIIPIYSLANYARQFNAGVTNVSGSSLAQLSNLVISGHPVLYYGWSSYERAYGRRNHAKLIVGAHNGLYHVFDPCYFSSGQRGYSMGRNAYDWGAESWQTWGNIASEYNGSALTIY